MGRTGIFSGRGGAAGGTGAAGDGGAVEKVKLTAKTLLDASIIEIFADRGGDATESASGGAGGALTGVVMKLDAGSTENLFIGTERGGSAEGGAGSGIASEGGAGGSVHDGTIKGDIGNFARIFDINHDGIDLSDMGGLFAGTGGTGGSAGAAGSVFNITATRIASILAVNSATTSFNLAAINAVTSIANITAKVIGADVNNDGTFTIDNDNAPSGFVLGTGDEVFDGIVIVKAGGFDDASVSVDPFKLV